MLNGDHLATRLQNNLRLPPFSFSEAFICHQLRKSKKLREYFDSGKYIYSTQLNEANILQISCTQIHLIITKKEKN